MCHVTWFAKTGNETVQTKNPQNVVLHTITSYQSMRKRFVETGMNK